MVDGWGNAIAPTPVDTSPRTFVCTRAAVMNQDPFAARPRPRASADENQVARLHHRPSVQPTETCTPKHEDTRAEVTTSQSGPDATKAPLDTRPPWVNPSGISSQWCVTRTIGGLSGSAARTPSWTSSRLACAQVQSRKGFVQHQDLGVAHQSPSEEDLLALALRDHAEGTVPDSETPPRARSRSAFSQSSSVYRFHQVSSAP